jgi:hypothetical protein
MVDLLTPDQRAQVEAALGDVADTFLTHPMTYYKVKTVSLDPWAEDRGDTFDDADVIPITGLPAYIIEERSESDSSPSGSNDPAVLDVTCWLDDMITAGLVAQTTEQVFLGNVNRDYFDFDGERYRLTMFRFDGPIRLGGLSLLLILRGRRQENSNAT